MKLELLKKLIKEAVSETVAPTVTKYEKHRPVVARPVPTGDPIADLMNETKYSMTQGEYQNLISATSDMVQAPGLGMNPIEGFRQGPEPGLDITQFDFMMKAGEVYKASVEKDKQRFGA